MRCTQSGVYTKWKKDSIKIGGYTGKFDEHKQDIFEQFEYSDISFMTLQGVFYLFTFGIIMAMVLIIIEIILKILFVNMGLKPISPKLIIVNVW